jgi:hypothetical protein
MLRRQRLLLMTDRANDLPLDRGRHAPAPRLMQRRRRVPSFACGDDEETMTTASVVVTSIGASSCPSIAAT